MEVLTPRTLAEAVDLRAEHRGALPIQGGTDVMVAFNFDRARPDVVLNLNEVAALRGWSREDGEVRLGAGLTYTEAMEGELASLLPALAEASPAGEAVPRLPPIVPRLRICGEPTVRDASARAGNSEASSPSIASV